MPKVATSFSASHKEHFRTILQNFHNFFVIFLSLLIKTNDSLIGRVNQNTATSSAVAKLINRCLAAQSSKFEFGAFGLERRRVSSFIAFKIKQVKDKAGTVTIKFQSESPKVLRKTRIKSCPFPFGFHVP